VVQRRRIELRRVHDQPYARLIVARAKRESGAAMLRDFLSSMAPLTASSGLAT
jgi:PIN domain nuclease of toxin-antitoxin system